ncbi:MAG: hypothetical protein IJ065_06495 [Eubacterium sp.]|nr:hypothetical protein [Eubacterium sp.]
MINYYEELNLNRSDSVEDIKKTLNQLESTWRNREVRNPEKATKMLALIIEARKIFISEMDKKEYDKNLDMGDTAEKTVDPDSDKNAQMIRWMSDAAAFLDTDQKDLAKTAIDKALQFAEESGNEELFLLASEIYSEVGMFQQSVDYANKAIVDNTASYRGYSRKIMTIDSWLGKMKVDDPKGKELLDLEMATLKTMEKLATGRGDDKTIGYVYSIYAHAYHNYLNIKDDKLAEEYAEKSLKYGSYTDAERVLDSIKAEKLAVQKEIYAKEQAEAQRKAEEKKRRERAMEEERYKQMKLEEASRAQTSAGVMMVIAWIAFVVVGLGFHRQVSSIIVIGFLAYACNLRAGTLLTVDDRVSKVVGIIWGVVQGFISATNGYVARGYGAASAGKSWGTCLGTIVISVIVALAAGSIGYNVGKSKTGY